MSQLIKIFTIPCTNKAGIYKWSFFEFVFFEWLRIIFSGFQVGCQGCHFKIKMFYIQFSTTYKVR